MKTFYFNTGVDVTKVINFPYEYHLNKGNRIADNGILTIPFECNDVPEDATFLYACDKDNFIENKDIIVRKIESGNLLSKYAYFKLPAIKDKE